MVMTMVLANHSVVINLFKVQCRCQIVTFKSVQCHPGLTTYIFNFRHSGTLALRAERQSARMSEIKNGGLDLYGTGLFEQQQFGTAGVEGVNSKSTFTRA